MLLRPRILPRICVKRSLFLNYMMMLSINSDSVESTLQNWKSSLQAEKLASEESQLSFVSENLQSKSFSRKNVMKLRVVNKESYSHYQLLSLEPVNESSLKASSGLRVRGGLLLFESLDPPDRKPDGFKITGIVERITTTNKIVLNCGDCSFFPNIAVDSILFGHKMNNSIGDSTFSLIDTMSAISTGQDKNYKSLHLYSNIGHLFTSSKPEMEKFTLEGAAKREYFNADLNSSQKLAIENCISQPKLSIIHGPPGTGKTTTLAELATQLVRNEKKRILMCAPSNTAVDNIIEKLLLSGLKEEDILRLGHPGKLSDVAKTVSLSKKMYNSSDYEVFDDMKDELLDIQQRLSENYTKSDSIQKKELLHDLHKRRDKVFGDELLSASVVLATVTKMAGIRWPAAFPISDFFHAVIIDECAQGMEPECWFALQFSSKVILAGDHFQLEPTIVCRDPEVVDTLSVSLMERLVKTGWFEDATVLLDCQYRMNSHIATWSNREFYQSKLKHDDSVASGLVKDLPKKKKEPVKTVDESTLQLPSYLGPELIEHACAFFDTADESGGFGDTFDEFSVTEELNSPPSKSNPGEASVLHQILRVLIRCTDIDLRPCDIGIVSPYAGQVRLLREMFNDHDVFRSIWPDRLPPSMDEMDRVNSESFLEVSTIDGFQGREKEVILMSSVRSNENHSIGFLANLRRFNVAVTRAKRLFLLVGDSRTLTTEKALARLLDHIEEAGVSYRLDELASMGGNADFRCPIGLPPHHHHYKDDIHFALDVLKQEATQESQKSEKPKKKKKKNTDEAAKIKVDDSKLTNDEPEIVLQEHEKDENLEEESVAEVEASSKAKKKKKKKKACKDEQQEQVTAVTLPPPSALVNPPNSVICGSCQRCVPKDNLAMHLLRCNRVKPSNELRKAMAEGEKEVTTSGKHPVPMRQVFDKIVDKHSKGQGDDDDIDALVNEIERLDSTCGFPSCKKKCGVQGQVCRFCGRTYCYEHALPEIHLPQTCGHQVKLAAKSTFFKEQRSQFDPRHASVTQRENIIEKQRKKSKLSEKLKQMQDQRKASSSNK